MIDLTRPTADRLPWAIARQRAADREPTSGGHTVFVVPHPDDEVLIMGGLLARQLDAGASVLVVAVSDGEAALPRARSGSPGPDAAG